MNFSMPSCSLLFASFGFVLFVADFWALTLLALDITGHLIGLDITLDAAQVIATFDELTGTGI